MVQPRVEGTGFGYIVINGACYEYDVVIYPDGTVARRPKYLSSSRKNVYGHTPLSRREAEHILSKAGQVDYIVIGTGQYGALPVEDDAKELFSARAKLVLKPTRQAIEEYNRLAGEGHRVLAVFHVTC
ncbi:Mth938-like domain-containing protein [Hyperthermus butylicus]|uniref:Conserved euryarchaeal protein n=1 Tax=Hyperthermus butylicus (strain DSM 5456 / JCM 9403 / PLM1-5) TaxID=415426 RepID=A2BKN7_HYPBU|nr:Mth938-like domain-containing protein [Hyperthermus butylicus]ABM80548.1 conserved euryarchaeal protein [Hyperthermus butylicus DSM 5456]